MNSRNRLLIFTRYPEAGNTKTRLIPMLGAEGAARLQKRLTENMILQAGLLERQLGNSTVIHYSGGSKKAMTDWLGPISCIEQAAGDIGMKMQAAFHLAFSQGIERAVLIGTDIPDLSAEILNQAFNALQTVDVVIGPSRDGGYYLIGLTESVAPEVLDALFQNMFWSQGEVFAETILRLKKFGRRVTILPILADIDLPEDLAGTRGLL